MKTQYITTKQQCPFCVAQLGDLTKLLLHIHITHRNYLEKCPVWDEPGFRCWCGSTFTNNTLYLWVDHVARHGGIDAHMLESLAATRFETE